MRTLNENQPIAKKVHKCDWCGEFIKIGEKYHYWTGVYDGVIGDTKMHLECNQAFIDSTFDRHETWLYYEQQKGKVFGYEE